MKSITTVLLCFLILGCGSRDKLPIPALLQIVGGDKLIIPFC